jgi:enoyl-CoA hydratase/carnithine racemase
MKKSFKIINYSLFKYFCSKIRYRSNASIGEITISNAEKRNALSHSIINELSHKISEIEVSANPPNIVILSSDGSVFSSGHDLHELLHSKEKERIMKDCCDLMKKIRNSKLIFIAEVHGLATAAGFQLVETCDMIVASSKASFSIPGLKIGLYASTPAVEIIENIPRKIAFDILLKGSVYTAREAYKYNYINYVVDLDHMNNLIKEKEILREFTMKIVEKINNNDMIVLKQTLYKD